MSQNTLLFFLCLTLIYIIKSDWHAKLLLRAKIIIIPNERSLFTGLSEIFPGASLGARTPCGDCFEVLGLIFPASIIPLVP